ncbi:MAG TPA: DUF4159 domain-containing protein [bacterium]|nr:DUF4159 domain-containing protein [bacterium]HPN30358.1 DUF4159 domain-containing protein [bacterium]
MKKLNYLGFKILFLFCLICFAKNGLEAQSVFTIGRLKYSGGGDWYANPTSPHNVLNFLSKNFGFKVSEPEVVIPEKKELIKTPFLFITGHGNIKLSESEISNIREFIFNGGFIFIDDTYGLDKSIRPLLKKILPESALVELPHSHKIYHSYYHFKNGLPKIHEHDNLPAQGFGVYLNDRLAVFYTYQSDISDGTEDEWVHNDPPELRENAMKMFVNIIIYNMLYN